MTDKVLKIRTEVERLYVYWDGVMQSSAATEAVARKNQCKELLSFIDSMEKEPVSEDLEEEIIKRWKILHGSGNSTPFDTFNGIACYFATWQKEQFEKNRLKHCNSITNEQAELEQGFIDQHLEKNNRMPTFLDAIEYGMRLQKEQMMKGLCFETKVYLESDGCAEDFNESEWLDLEKTEITELPVDALGLKAGEKVKIIIVKEE